MKNLILLLLLAPIFSFSQSYVSPIDFQDNDENRNKVIDFIENDVRRIHWDKDVETRRMFAQLELDDFKELIKVKNKRLLKQVEKESCFHEYGFDVCSYSWILSVYKRRESEGRLEW